MGNREPATQEQATPANLCFIQIIFKIKLSKEYDTYTNRKNGCTQGE